MQLYIFPVVLVFGWINNTIAVVVLLSKTYRKTSTGFLMIALAVADFGVVSTGLLRQWIIALTRYDIRMASTSSCRVHNFLTYLTVSVSSWSLAIIAIERTICVCNPLRCKEIASRRRIYIAWVVCFLLIFGVQSNFLWTYDIYYTSYCMMDCTATAEYDSFHNGGVYEWLDLVISSLGPFGVILPCNVIIITKILKSRARRQAMSSVKNSKGISSTTIMLTVTSVLFFILTAPMAFFLLVMSYLGSTLTDFADIDFMYTIFYILFNLNSSINFLLYCASGTKFRRTLRAMCCPQTITQGRGHRSQITANTSMTASRASVGDVIINTVTGDAGMKPSNNSTTGPPDADLENDNHMEMVAQKQLKLD